MRDLVIQSVALCPFVFNRVFLNQIQIRVAVQLHHPLLLLHLGRLVRPSLMIDASWQAHPLLTLRVV